MDFYVSLVDLRIYKNHASCTNKLDNLVDNVEVARSVLKICFSNQCQ